MPEVARLTGDDDGKPDGFSVRTQSAGDTFRYEFRRTDEDTVELVERTKNGDPVELTTTDSVEEALEDRGLEVAE